MDSSERPTGTVTFLVTDIEQSTRRWEEQPDEMREALARHDATLRQAIERNGGWLFKHTGDGVLAAFAAARGAIDAAIMAQRELNLPVRMGISTGEAESRNGDYYGPPLNRAARIMSAGHGGQVIVAQATAAIVDGVELIDLGEHRLRDLTRPQQLYQIRAEGLRETFPALKSLNFIPGNLPQQATSFLGREKDVKEVAAWLRTSRLVTLSGVGGVGKTRLAIHAAGETSANYPDGVWLVELAAVRDSAAIVHAVAAVLDVAQQPRKTIEQSLVASLAGRRLLLVLDNCEHLIDAVASLAHQIVAQCAQTTIIATSREALMIDGERIYPVPSLGFREGAPSPAIDLFVDRARAVAPEFELGRDEAAIREICRRLDGIPLAVELAAARTRSMSPAQIRDNLNERFRLLTGGMRGALERHQTLRHAVQWSYDLLSQPERALLARASVFAGGFTSEAAEKVCVGGVVEAIDILDLLDSLVRKSLVMFERPGASTRYGLLETIRQFGEDQRATMGEAEAVQLRHARYFAEDSDANFKIWRSSSQLVAYEWLDREMDNLRSAFRWSKDSGHVDAAARIASNVGDIARFRMREEATGWPEEIVDAAREMRHPRLAVLLTWAASSGWGLGRLEEAKRFGEEAIALAGDARFDPFVWAFTDLAYVALLQGDAGRAMELVRAGAAQEADRRDRFCYAVQLVVLSLSGAAAEARAIADEVVAQTEAAGVPCSICFALFGKGEAFAETDPVTALRAYQQTVALARQTGNRIMVSIALPKIAALLSRGGDPAVALHSFRQMLESSGGSRDVVVVSYGFGNLIVLFERLGQPTTAATLNGALTQIVDANALVPELAESISRIRDQLDEAAFREASRVGAAMPVQQANDFALAEIARALATIDAKE